MAYDGQAEGRGWLLILRIIGVALSVPPAAIIAVLIRNDAQIRRNWLEDFAGFNRQLIISHLPRSLRLNSDEINGTLRSETQIWRSIDPRFLELSEQDQVEKIESLLEKERNGYPTPDLFQLRKTTSFPQGYELEVRRVSQDRLLGLAAGAGFLILLIIQVLISILGWFIKGCAEKDESASEGPVGSWMGVPHRYIAPRIANNRF